MSKKAISTCFKRFANSVPWEKGEKGGTDYYLCKIDLNSLKTHAYELAFTENAFDTESFREDALRVDFTWFWMVYKIIIWERIHKSGIQKSIGGKCWKSSRAYFKLKICDL